MAAISWMRRIGRQVLRSSERFDLDGRDRGLHCRLYDVGWSLHRCMDSTLFFRPLHSKIVATAPTANVNGEFNITVERQDQFGNVRVADAAASVVAISTRSALSSR